MINIQQTNYKPQKLQKAEHKKINIFVRFFLFIFFSTLYLFCCIQTHTRFHSPLFCMAQASNERTNKSSIKKKHRTYSFSAITMERK